MLIDNEKNMKQKMEICSSCMSKLENSDYIYRRVSTIIGYLCSNCGFSEFYDVK